MKSELPSLSTWALNISPSPTLLVDGKAKSLQSMGEDVCGFGAGEPDFDTPDHIKEACKKAIDQGKTKYIPAAGLPELRKAIADECLSRNKIQGLKDSNVVVSPGGKFSCYLAILATCQPGDEVIIPAPYWVSYPEMVKLSGATPKIIHTSDDTNFKITPEQLKNAITPKTKLFIFNSPSNPTGVIYSPKEIEALMEVVLAARIRIMSDEIYERLIYDDAQHLSPASLSKEAAEATITVSGFSKTYSMTGWRLGTLVASDSVIKAVNNLQSHTTSNATTFAQYGALAALTQKEATQTSLNKMLAAFDRRRIMLWKGLNAIQGITCLKSTGAFYLFPKISTFNLTSNDFANQLLEKEKVAVVPGIGFGADDYIRLSYATSDEVIKKGLERLKRFCESI